MRPPGSFKIARRYNAESVSTPTRSGGDTCLHPHLANLHRSERILDSLREEIIEGGEGSQLRIRCVFREPSELFRVELRRPQFDYCRITLLDRESLEDLLETDGVRAIVEKSPLGGSLA